MHLRLQRPNGSKRRLLRRLPLVIGPILFFITVFIILWPPANRPGPNSDEIWGALPAPEVDRQARLNDLVDWAESTGARLHRDVKLSFRGSAGWGLVSQTQLSSGELVCAVPEKLLVFPSSEEGSVVFNLANELLRTRNTSIFAKSLPWERFENSYKFEFENDVQEAWKASDFQFDEQDFRAAVFLVISRIHAVGLERRAALVPLCDMFNTAINDFNVECSTFATSDVVCHTVKAVNAGHELLVLYRTRDGTPATPANLKSQWMIL